MEKKPESDDRRYDRAVKTYLDSVKSTYQSLKRHRFPDEAARGPELCAQSEEEYLSILNRACPVTETEHAVAATIRWLIKQNRGTFTKAMFRDRYASVSLLAGPRMAETGLGIEDKTFSLRKGQQGFLIEHKRKSDRRDRGGNRPTEGKKLPGATPVPVLDESKRRELLERLDAEAAAETDAELDAAIADLGEPPLIAPENQGAPLSRTAADFDWAEDDEEWRKANGVSS